MKFHDIRRYWYSPLTYIHRASDSYSTGNFRSFDKLWQKYSDICNNRPFQYYYDHSTFNHIDKSTFSCTQGTQEGAAPAVALCHACVRSCDGVDSSYCGQNQGEKKWKWKAIKQKNSQFTISPHDNLRSTIALLPHNQNAVWTQPKKDV